MKSFKFGSLLFLIAVAFRPAFASDHIDGAASIENGQADLTDLYAFKTEGEEDRLSIILNMYPGISEGSHFSSKVSYKITIRNAQKNSVPFQKGFNTFVSDELSIDCSFSDPSHHSQTSLSQSGEVRCLLKKEDRPIDEASGEVGDILNAESFKVFTGARSDSFFISAEAFLETTARKGYVTADVDTAKNSMSTINVMSIAVDLDLEALGLSGKLLALTGQSYTLRGGVFETLDRVGRPEITNLSLHDLSGSSPLKREFNKVNAFQPYSTLNTKFEERLIENIKAYDRLDSKIQWGESDLKDLTRILVDDFLIVDVSNDCDFSKASFLSIELEMLRGVEVLSCGGRSLTDDIMKSLYALYIGGLEEERFSLYETGVSMPYQNNEDKAISNTFPYLASPSKTTPLQKILFEAAKLLQE